ncbi:hypothetical protein D3C75_923360 [compost metagenome]
MAVIFDFRPTQQLVNRLRCLSRGRCLLPLPALVGLERQHAQGRQRGIIGPARTALG